MMQSQGLGALMPQGAQQMAPQQPPPNPQRLAAATNLVSSDAERQILDPRTLAMLKYKDALQAMQAADQMMAAAQPAPTPPTVAERTKLAAEQGIAGLTSRLSPGIQQQGNNMQAQQMQQAMSGGLPQLPAPNMTRMAEGGIVGYSQGDLVEDPIVGRLPDGTPVYASDVARREQYAALGGAVPTSPVTPTTAPEQAPAPRQMEAISEADALSAMAPAQSAATSAPAEPSSRYTEQLEAMLEQIQGKTFDEEAAADARSAELKRLVGTDDLVAQRAEAERRRRELAETRFSPEAQRRRALRAGLAGLAERGLGGFSSGAGAEDERIYAEQAAESERSVAEMDRLIADFRQMGMTEFEARNAARTAVQGQEQTQQQRQADILATLVGREDAEAGRALQARQLDTQIDVANIQANAGQFARSLEILVSSGMTEFEALKELATMTQRVGVDPNDALWQESVNAAFEQVSSNPTLLTSTPEARTEAAEKLARSMYSLKQGTPAAPTTTDAPPQYATNPSTGERIVSTDGGVNWQPVQ